MHSHIRVTEKIFAVLVDLYHHIVLTLYFKLVSFFYIYNSLNRLKISVGR